MCLGFRKQKNKMKYLLLLVVLLCVQFSFANNFTEYKNHIAKERLLLQFGKNVSADAREEVIRSSGLASSFYHIPSPAVTICMVSDLDLAQKYFALKPEVELVSFFITDGKNYAGVLNSYFVKITDKNFEPLLREKLRALNTGEPQPDKYIPNLYSISNLQSSYSNVIDICAQLQTNAWCQYASPNYLLNPMVCSNDPIYNRQWHIQNLGTPLQGSGTPDADMDVDTAWSITTGNGNIKIGIVDSGVDTLHEDLVANMLPGHDAVSDSTDGYPTPAFDEDGHGTCCAGIAAAVKDNTKGVAGVAPSCKIIPVRGFYYVSPGPGTVIPVSTAAAFADAIGWAWTNGADILSNSWGLPASLIGLLPGGTQPVNDAIQTAYTNGRSGKGIAMFFSSGNEEDPSGPIWPAELPQTIAVNATSMCDERKNGSDCSGETWSGNWGIGLDFSAPGVKISTTDMTGANGFSTGNYSFTFNGTSAACPNAAAVGALLLSVRPDLTAEDVRNIIARTCDKVGGYGYDSLFYNGTWSNELGYGRVNAYAALQLAPLYSPVKNLENDFAFTVFPNPANGILNIELKEEKGEMKIFDLRGRQLKIKTLQKGLNRETIVDLPSAIYILQVVNLSGHTATEKISVLH